MHAPTPQRLNPHNAHCSACLQLHRSSNILLHRCCCCLLLLPLPHRDEQLAKFQTYLEKEECMHINCIVRARSRMAYPMKKK